MDCESKSINQNTLLYNVDNNSEHSIILLNSGDLEVDFYKYATNFYEAAETVIHYLIEEASLQRDIATLDLWYFAMIYLYRQSIELIIKANIFKITTKKTERKTIIEQIRHDLKQGYEKLFDLKNLELNINENTRWLHSFLSDISYLDSSSDMFRYPFGNDFSVLFNEQTSISLIETYKNMNRAYSILKEMYTSGVPPEYNYESSLPKLIPDGGRYYYLQSVVGYKFADRDFYPYYASYKQIADYLRDKILKENKLELFIPMCYMYRNAVELGLKRIIFEDSYIDPNKALKILKRKKHSILGLWNSFIEGISRYKTSFNSATLNTVSQYIQELHSFDHNSDLFRYPCNKNIDSYFLNEEEFDIENLSVRFKELCDFLERTDDLLKEIIEYEQEEKYDSPW